MGIRSEVRMGDEIRIAGASLYPLTRIISTFWKEGGAVWNRPDAVLVKTDAGEEHVLQIRDITREFQIRILAAGILASLFLWLINKGR